MVKLKILRWGGVLDYPGDLNGLTKVLMRGRQEGQSERRRCEDRSGGQCDVTMTQGM